jgi:DNA-binding CsgD family transcriptional regulator
MNGRMAIAGGHGAARRTGAHGMAGSAVLALMAEGRSNSAIADRLYVSERGVEKHISNIFSKLALPRPAPATAASSPSSPASAPELSRGRLRCQTRGAP